jgi:hypothetical protein
LASQVFSKYETTDRPGKPAATRKCASATVDDLQPRLAIVWVGSKAVAAAVYRLVRVS